MGVLQKRLVEIINKGKVEPTTKNSITNVPKRKLPEARAIVCTVKVKPQGRKKVRQPSKKGEILGIFLKMRKLEKQKQSNPTIFKPLKIKIKEIKIRNQEKLAGESLKY